ncbi:MAG: uridine kinase [Clostridia bacterium]
MKNNMFIIGVAGGSGSGKTTFANHLNDAFAPCATIISHDFYYKDHPNLTFEERSKINYDHPNSLDTDAMIADIKALKKGKHIFHPTYCFKTHKRLPETVEVAPNKILIVEGILIFENKELCNLFDVKLFVDTDDDVRFIRRLSRDTVERGRSMESVIKQYLTTIKPMHQEFVEPSKRNADIIIPEGGNNMVAVNMVIDAIHKKLLPED